MTSDPTPKGLFDIKYSVVNNALFVKYSDQIELKDKRAEVTIATFISHTRQIQ